MKDLLKPLVVLLSVCSPVAAQQVPKLVVLLTVDEFRTDLYEAMAPHLSEGGLARLTREGRVYDAVIHPLATADPVASEAVLQTGTLGLTSGITDRRAVVRKEGGKRSRQGSILEDKNYIGYATADRLSPLALRAPVLADRLSQATHGLGQVFSIAPCAEEAIIAGGHEAQAAYWLDDSTARWVSSTFYPAGLPWYISKSSTVATRLDKGSITWQASDPTLYASLLPFASNGAFASDHIYTRAFASVQDLKHSPVVNEYVIRLAEAIIDGAGLGADLSVDLLALHLTAGTPPGVSAGISPELLDSYYLLDRAVGELMDLLDKKFGQGEVLLALTGNGMARQELIRNEKKRYPTFSPERCRAITNMYLHAKYGIKGLVTEVTAGGELYLDRALIEKKDGLTLAEVQDAVSSFLLEMAGVSYTIPGHTLRDLLPGDRIGTARLTALHSALPSHRADVFVGISPGYVVDQGTEPAQPSYAPMPTMLILWGAGIEPEVITVPLDLRRVSREISHVLRIRPPTP